MNCAGASALSCRIRFLFSGTVEGNIRLGTTRIQEPDVEQAAEDVNLADFIRTLPGGFKEEVRERGSTLSTGQKQLISFARALAHNPKILILDEATSSVDTETEFRVRDALNRMVEGRTALIIAHRLSTIQRADKIIVMHKGQVREVGSHQQLLAQRGIYYKLYQLQYKDQEIAWRRLRSLRRTRTTRGFRGSRQPFISYSLRSRCLLRSPAAARQRSENARAVNNDVVPALWRIFGTLRRRSRYIFIICGTVGCLGLTKALHTSRITPRTVPSWM